MRITAAPGNFGGDTDRLLLADRGSRRLSASLTQDTQPASAHSSYGVLRTWYSVLSASIRKSPANAAGPRLGRSTVPNRHSCALRTVPRWPRDHSPGPSLHPTCVRRLRIESGRPLSRTLTGQLTPCLACPRRWLHVPFDEHKSTANTVRRTICFISEAPATCARVAGADQMSRPCPRSRREPAYSISP